MGWSGSTLATRSLLLASALSVACSHQSWSAGAGGGGGGGATTVTTVQLTEQMLQAEGNPEVTMNFATGNLTVYEAIEPVVSVSSVWSYVSAISGNQGAPAAVVQGLTIPNQGTPGPTNNAAAMTALTALYNQYAALSQKLAALQPSIASLQNQLKALPPGSSKVPALKNQVTSLQTTFAVYQSQLTTLYSQMVPLLPAGQAASIPGATLTTPINTLQTITKTLSNQLSQAKLQTILYNASISTQNLAYTLQYELGALQVLAAELAPRVPLSITPVGSAQSARVPSVTGLVRDPFAFNTPPGRVSSGTEGFNADLDLGAWFKWPQGSGLHLLGGIYFNEARLTAGPSVAPIGPAQENWVTEMVGARYDFGRNYVAAVAHFDQGHTQLNNAVNGGSTGFGTSAYFVDGIAGHVFTLWNSGQAGPVWDSRRWCWICAGILEAARSAVRHSPIRPASFGAMTLFRQR